jgi:hypothetical protein
MEPRHPAWPLSLEDILQIEQEPIPKGLSQSEGIVLIPNGLYSSAQGCAPSATLGAGPKNVSTL